MTIMTNTTMSIMTSITMTITTILTGQLRTNCYFSQSAINRNSTLMGSNLQNQHFMFNTILTNIAITKPCFIMCTISQGTTISMTFQTNKDFLMNLTGMNMEMTPSITQEKLHMFYCLFRLGSLLQLILCMHILDLIIKRQEKSFFIKD